MTHDTLSTAAVSGLTGRAQHIHFSKISISDLFSAQRYATQASSSIHSLQILLEKLRICCGLHRRDLCRQA
jgi:hypothetical protein